MSKYSTNDHYIDHTVGVLKNKLNIKEENILDKAEADYAATRSVELANSPLDHPFTIETLKMIHKILFGDLYEWAGSFRTVDIEKGTARFANVKHIDDSIAELFSDLKKEDFLLNLNKEMFSKRTAYYMGELNAIHPFREGNGRTQRELLSQLAYKNELYINWSAMHSEDILNATISSFSGNYSFLKTIIFENLKSFED